MRILIFEKSVEKPENITLQCRKIYSRVWKIFKTITPDAKSGFPMEYKDTFINIFNQFEPEEYERFIFLIEKCIFSKEGITEAEYRTVYMFYNRVKTRAYEIISWKKYFYLKYIDGI